MRLAGYQPQYFPRLHYFARILDADIFKISDSLQYVRRHAYPLPGGGRHNGPSYQAHAPLKTASGLYLMDIPVQHMGPQRERMLNTVAPDYGRGWVQKHLRMVEVSYKKAPQFKKLFPSLTGLLEVPYESLAACTIATTLWGLCVLLEVPFVGVEPALAQVQSALPKSGFRLRRIVRMSEHDLEPAHKEQGEDVNAWLINQCKALGADEYYFGGTAAGAYIDEGRLRRAGISLIQQDWRGEEYPQQFQNLGFIQNLSIIDLLMNVSPAHARRTLHTPSQ